LNDLCIYIFGVVCKHFFVLFTGKTRFRSNQGKVGNLFVALVLSSERQLQDYCGEDLREEDAPLLFPGREDKRGAFYLSLLLKSSHTASQKIPRCYFVTLVTSSWVVRGGCLAPENR